MNSTAKQNNLFPGAVELGALRALWRKDPAQAFAAFVASPQYVTTAVRRNPACDAHGNPYPMSSRSCRVHAAMFTAFLRWKAQHQPKRTLFELTMEDLSKFLDEKTALKRTKKTSTIRLRYLRMLRKVFAHLGYADNPAERLEQAYGAEARDNSRASKFGRDLDTAAIPARDLQAFIDHLPDADKPGQWKRRRDRAMQAVMLGAGLTVDEVIQLRIEDVAKPDLHGLVAISVRRKPGSTTHQEHDTVLWAELVPIVLAWVAERRSLKIGGRLLFPAGPVGSERAAKPLDPATVWRQARKTFERAGIVVPRAGARTLRNTFAARELAEGTPREVVKELMGHHDPRAIEVYVRAKQVFRG